MRILSIGMMVCDTLLAPVPFDILQADSVSIRRPVISCGGDALNVALGLARLGCSVSIIGRIAEDANGNYIRKACWESGIDDSGLILDEDCPTASSYALIDPEGERHFLSEKSIFGRLRGEDVPDRSIAQADIVYFGSVMAMRAMNEGGLADVFSRARAAGKLTAMDAAVNREDGERDWMSLLAPAFRQTDVFFPSLEEAVLLTGKRSPREIAECFRPFRMKIFGVKLGAKGCYVTDYRKEREISCPRGLPVVDTTGAGDSFMAGLLCGLSMGWDAFASAGFAGCVASRNVGAMGGAGGIPDRKEAVRFYREWTLGFKNCT